MRPAYDLELLLYRIFFALVLQKKLESEVVKIDGQYESKKRKFLEDSEQFRRELKKASVVPMCAYYYCRRC